MISIALVALYILSMVGIGIWAAGRTKTSEDFFLGGRGIGAWISAFSYGTSYFSAVVFIGFAGKLGWGFGLNALWIALGNILFGSLLAWLVLGRRTRRMSHNLQSMTMPEFFQARFDARRLKVLSAAIIFVFLLPYSASVFQGLSYLFEAQFHIDYTYALLLMIILTGVYLVLGGYFAVTLTSFVQGLIMLVGSVIMVGVLLGQEGGLGQTLAAVRDTYADHVAAPPPWWIIACLVFMTSFGPWGLPQMVQKYYAIRDEKLIWKGALATTFFAAIVVTAAYFVGTMTHLHFDAPPLTEARAPAFDRMVPELLAGRLPDILMALVLVLILSASMSTLASLILVSSSCVVIDAVKPLWPSLSDARRVRLLRVFSGLFILVSCLIALYRPAVIVTLVSLSWGTVAGAFMAPFLLGLFWKGATKTGVTAGMLSALVIMIGLFFHWGPGMSPVAATIAMLAPFVVIPAVSLVTRKPPVETLEKAFDGV
jgi:SSS family solute:Na+ symporter